jgi:hypothetical protein
LAYWQKQFTVDNRDIEYIYNQILEGNRLVSLDEIALALIKRHCDREELESRNELHQGKLYQPKESYEVGENVVFPVLEYAVGSVKYSRAGRHPEYGQFTVIGVTMTDGEETVREFATNLHHDHALNTMEQSLSTIQGLLAPEELYQSYQATIQPKLKAALAANSDFVEFHGQYYLKDLLTEFHEGLFNIADAAIDINNGPLSVDALIEQKGLLPAREKVTDVMRFSVSYRLAMDERFHDVGPTGQSLWYLERLEPPEAYHTPRRLQVANEDYDVGVLDDTLYAVLTEIDDEATHPDDMSAVGSEINEVTLVLNYPHWRVGTLPLTPKTLSFFPISHYNPVRFEFVDGRTGNTFPGWVVLSGKYIFGLDEWYKKNKLPTGAYIRLKRSKDPMQVIIDFESTRTQREWIRTATVTHNKLTFQMNKEAIGCKYDELMILGERNPVEMDNLWLTRQAKEQPLYNLLCDIFPELSKLSPQSTVHVKTLYSAVNVVHRASPGTIFQELVQRDCFIPVDHGYWVYDPNLRD